MSDAPLVSINTAIWSQKIVEFAKIKGITVADAIREEFRFTLKRVIRLTPPDTRKQGEGAVKRDIRRAMRSFEPSNYRSESLRKVVLNRDVAAFNIIAARVKSGPMAGVTAVRMTTDVHMKARDRRGRVTKDLKQVVLGRDSVLLQKYIAENVGWVGVAKAGWLPAYEATGGDDAQGWISRHRPAGAVIDKLAETSPSITAINRTPWAVRKDEGQRIIANAFTSRAKDIATKIKAAIRLAKEKAQLASA